MNTIKIREKYPELIERIRSNVRAYKDFTQFTQKDDGIAVGASLYRDNGVTLSKDDYLDFINRCFQEDIRELNELMKIENE